MYAIFALHGATGKMRTDYGKLVYLLQDSNAPRIKELLEFQCVQPIKTVHSSLKAADALGLLADELLPVATMEVLSNNRPRHLIQRDIKHKNHAVEILARKYANAKISQDDIRHCLYSIADNSSFLNANSLPVEKMLHFLHRYFNPSEAEEGFSLSIQSGRGGSRLSHDHRRQFHFVEQSMLLWREILNDFYKLWFLAEDDLLSERNQYRLCNTGQGLNRVQSVHERTDEIAAATCLVADLFSATYHIPQSTSTSRLVDFKPAAASTDCQPSTPPSAVSRLPTSATK